jgi:hypothetical protein
VFRRWDAGWYLEIATHGYRPIQYRDASHASQAFFPGYPLAVRGTAALTGVPEFIAALLVAAVAGTIAVVVLWRVVEEVAGPDAARRAVTLFCFSPGAFVLSMAYSEAMFIAAAAGSLWMLMRRSWLAAGILGAAATATRPNGAALVVTCLIAAAVAIRHDREWGALVAPGLAVTGLLGYFGYLFARTGDPFAWFTVQRRGWGDRIAPVEGLLHHLSGIPSSSFGTGALNDLVWVLSGLLGAAGVALLVAWRPPLPLLAYGVLSAAWAACSYQVGLRPRMLLAAFPVVLAIGVQLEGRAYRVAVVASGATMVVLTVLSFGTLAAFP